MWATAVGGKFDAGEDICSHLDLSRAHRPELQTKRVNVDFPLWMVQNLDREAPRLGVAHQALIKLWVAERLEQLKQ